MSITDLAKPEFWQQLLSSDFNRGYIAGLGLVIALLVFLFIIKIIVKIVFRTHRCSSIPVPCVRCWRLFRSFPCDASSSIAGGKTTA